MYFELRHVLPHEVRVQFACCVVYHAIPGCMWSYVQPQYNNLLQDKTNKKNHKNTRRDDKFRNKVTKTQQIIHDKNNKNKLTKYSRGYTVLHSIVTVTCHCNL